jgi:hypothetical protein
MAAVTSEMKLDMDLGDAPALARGGAALRVARLTGARTRRRRCAADSRDSRTPAAACAP